MSTVFMCLSREQVSIVTLGNISYILLLFKSWHDYYLLPTPQISPHERINILPFKSFISPMLYHGIARNLLITFCSVLRATIAYFCGLTSTIILQHT